MSLARRNGRARMAVATVQAPVRVAAYGRVSTEAQAEKEFNSVEVQRLACEKYVELHRDEGWTLLPDRFEDPGYSGSNTRRPGLEGLLAAIEAGQVDAVIVQRLDRLSRSMLDFLKMLEFFERHGVSFISVSQRFDTSTPVGEMTMNILLAFAQFERQIIAERTRDKVHAARRRGQWTGGMPPLGYDVVAGGGKLVVNREEAEQVKAIFELYAEKGSLVATSEELNKRGWRRKSWTTKTGAARHGKPWDRVNLHRVLTDPLYVGMQKLGDDVFPGEHPAIVAKSLFRKVQALLAENRSNGGASQRNQHGALLRGLLRCSACDSAMGFAPTKKGNRVYRYYRCCSAMKRGEATCATGSIPADRIEAFVVNEIKRIGSDPELQRATFEQAVAQLKTQRRGLRLEEKRLRGDLTKARSHVEQLVGAITRTTGPAADAIQCELARAQGRVSMTEARQREIQAEVATIAAQDIDEADVARALHDFDELWSVLLVGERERILRLLIAGIRYDGSTGKLDIDWRLAGFEELAQEVGNG